MKRVSRQLRMILGMVFFMASVLSCGKGSSDGSKAIAENKNDEKFDSNSGEKEAQFVVDAVSERYAGLLLTDAAVKKSTDQEVKEVASTLKKEYTRGLEELMKYASSRAISIPTEATDTDQKKTNEI